MWQSSNYDWTPFSISMPVFGLEPLTLCFSLGSLASTKNQLNSCLGNMLCLVVYGA